MIAALLSTNLLATAVLAAAAPPAEPTTVAPAVAVAPAKKAKPEPGDTVCKRESVLGSRMKQRVCMTQADWDARRTSARDELDKAQTNMPAPK
ncbi:hypothetical protein [Phenylobacterium sp.]|uniref:hypothetical protein n=1 Tax=Phenylobacterium sp. TaxID=1871053 RepID=UPI0025EC5E23|nr:hypothetical protein [Phenylobacterium sp.]